MFPFPPAGEGGPKYRDRWNGLKSLPRTGCRLSGTAGIMTAMDSQQLIKRLEADGYSLTRDKGAHRQYAHPAGLLTLKHSGGDIPSGTLNGIRQQTGRKQEAAIMRFPIVLHSDDGVRFGVTVPDLPGCFSAGDTLDAALDSAAEAIDLHLEGLTGNGGAIPLPRPIAEHRANPDFADGVWAIVDVDISRFETRAEKINILLPRRLLEKIDSYAKTQGETRSTFLAEAARAAMR